MMWLDILNKLKQGKSFLLFRGELMNSPDYYEYEVEYINTHPGLIAE